MGDYLLSRIDEFNSCTKLLMVCRREVRSLIMLGASQYLPFCLALQITVDTGLYSLHMHSQSIVLLLPLVWTSV